MYEQGDYKKEDFCVLILIWEAIIWAEEAAWSQKVWLIQVVDVFGQPMLWVFCVGMV